MMANSPTLRDRKTNSAATKSTQTAPARGREFKPSPNQTDIMTINVSTINR
jgi:hypothetical protein